LLDFPAAEHRTSPYVVWQGEPQVNGSDNIIGTYTVGGVQPVALNGIQEHR
jgi:hypothetical protein